MRRAVLTICMMALTACGAHVSAPAAPADAGAKLLAMPTVEPTPAPGNIPAATPNPETRVMGVDFSRPLTVACTSDWPAGGPPTLRELLNAVRPGYPFGLAAALVSVQSVGAGTYNTPDGRRWTKAWVAQGNDPEIYTPFTFSVIRPLSASGGLASSDVITAFLNGGKTPYGDETESCIGQPTVTPVRAGMEAVVIFGGKLTAAGVNRPSVTTFDVVRGDAVVTMRGTEPIP